MPVSSLLMSSLSSSGGGGASPLQAIPNMMSAAVSGIAGLLQRRKAKKLLAGLTQPVYSTANEILQNQKRAELAANEGLPSQQYNNAMKNFKNNQANVLASAMDRRSALMALPKILQQTNMATGNLDAQDAAARQQNQRILYGINSEVGQYRDKEFQLNKMNPYQRDYNYAMGLLGAGNQNLISGVDKLFAGGGQLLSGSGGNGLYSSSSSKGSPSKPRYINATERFVPDNIYMDDVYGNSSLS